MIPQPLPDQRGWSVEVESGKVHLRYATDHAPNAVKVATVKGVENVLAGKTPSPCLVCFPHGARQKPNVIAQPGQHRRPPFTDPYEREP